MTLDSQQLNYDSSEDSAPQKLTAISSFSSAEFHGVLPSGLQIIEMQVSAMRAYAGNPRINSKAVDAVAESITSFGYRNLIIVDGDGEIICGHTRWKALQKLGISAVPVIVADDLNESQVRMLRIADNKTSELAEWDFDKLMVELQELQGVGADLSSMGFDESELDRILGNGGKAPQDDVAPELPEEAVSRRGELYQLGRHRLMCGDSLDIMDVQKLMDGALAKIVFTDPPYNMNYQSKSLGGIKNDKMSESHFVSFILASVMSMRRSMAPNASYYICMSAAEYPTVYHQLRKMGLEGRQIIWVKPSSGLGAQEYRPQFEVMLYGYLGKRENRTWNGARSQSDFWDFSPDRPLIAREAPDGNTVLEFGDGIETTQVFLDAPATGQVAFFDGGTSDLWRFKRPDGDYVHPTQKPVELVDRALKNSSNPGDIVLDFFGGSGSTLISSEKNDRTAYLMEVDPRYCDVIRCRYAEYVHGAGCDWQNVTPVLD